MFPNDFFDGKLDPNDQKPYRLKFKLKPNERLIAGRADIVDKQSKAVDPDSPVRIDLQNFGQISGVVWGVTAYVSMMSDNVNKCAVAWIRFRMEIDATPPLPITRKIDRTWGIRIKQQ